MRCGLLLHQPSGRIVEQDLRARLARQISDMNTNEEDIIPLLTMSPEWEQNFAESLVGTGEERQLSMAPSKLQEFISTLRNTLERQAMMGAAPIL